MKKRFSEEQIIGFLREAVAARIGRVTKAAAQNHLTAQGATRHADDPA
ncbi:MAG TPA: hypothetical protein PK620_05815 [Denitromonas sp.]|nr:hypothetical protein [Rhodocyclaceae bacterium]MCP5222826.1 hypothetical protein [Zoogloeaceae bacterium]HQU88259.1 hypothetical protein [Denitromonas sp.]HQV14411.1 hypothetical protein [Denitromonas sp.]